ncbi:MAG: hypothetical protein ABSF10_07605 [Verrucomicrobiota bacterium]
MTCPNADILDLRMVDEYHSRVQSKNFNRRLAAWLLALLLVVLGAKLWVIQVYGTAVPYWDQWDEARLLFKPWLEGHLTWNAWFAPHNEHRIFFTRALDLLELWFNRQWDPRLQMVINAFIHTGYACGLAYGLWIFTGRKHEGLICFLLMPFFAFPFAAENTIHGFHSQEYFLSIFAVVTIIGLGFGSPGGGWWFCGLATAVMSLFTMGSGLLASLAVIGLLLLRRLKRRGTIQGQWITLGCSLAVFISGLILDVAIQKHGHYRAGRFLTFGEALLGNLAWPFINQPALLLVICLPLVITVIKYFRSDFKDPRAAEFVLTLGFWGFLEAAALAYGREHLGNSSRYMDTLCTLSIASLASLFILGENTEYRRLSRPLVGLLAMAWAGCLFLGMWQISWATMGGGRAENYMQFSRRMGLIEEQNVRAFVVTDDPACLLDKPFGEVPYPDAGVLVELLRDPNLLRIMPAACRPPLKLERDEKSDAALVLNGCPPGTPEQEFMPVWGNCSNGVALAGHFVSKPLCATLPKLSLKLSCGPGLESVSLQLVEQSTGRRIELHPEITGRWQTIMVSAPQNPFRLEVTNQNHDTWVAVGEINQWGRFSYYALLLLNHAVVILLAGLGLGVLLSGWGVVRCIIGKSLFSNHGLVELLVLLAGLVALAWVWLERNFAAG